MSSAATASVFRFVKDVEAHPRYLEFVVQQAAAEALAEIGSKFDDDAKFAEALAMPVDDYRSLKDGHTDDLALLLTVLLRAADIAKVKVKMTFAKLDVRFSINRS